jgi:hypothetical protein
VPTAGVPVMVLALRIFPWKQISEMQGGVLVTPSTITDRGAQAGGGVSEWSNGRMVEHLRD